MFYDRFLDLCNTKNVKPSRVAIDAGFNKGSVSVWKKKYEKGEDTQPTPEILSKIADYFNVSIDYLLEKTDIKAKKELTTNDSDKLDDNLVAILNQLSPDSLEKVCIYSQSLLDASISKPVCKIDLHEDRNAIYEEKHLADEILKISKRINKAISDKNISYGELQRLTGIPKSALHRYATGTTKKIPIDRIELIAKFTNVSAAWIMGWESEAPTELTLTNAIETHYGNPAVQMLNLFNKLNSVGKSKMIDSAKDLLLIDKYTKPNTYIVKKAAGNGDFKEETITNQDIKKINNLPDAEDF